MAATSRFSFDLLLKLRNAAGAKSFVRQVSTPGSRLFHKYLTRSQWIARYGPTNASIAQAKSWARSQGFTVGAVPRTHLFVTVTGSAAQVERAFGVTLGYYIVNGHKVRLANGALTIPASVAGSVAGAVGVNESLASNDLSQRGRSPAVPAPVVPAQAAPEPPPPAGFFNAHPCTKAFNTRKDKADSTSLYSPPFSAPLDYDICGYLPGQIRSAYGISDAVTTHDGAGVAVAIVDAYDSPTLLSDSQRYFRQNDPGNVKLVADQNFFNAEPATTANFGECGASGWRAEQSLDVQAVHGMAPDAVVLYVGAVSCLNTDLLAALQFAVTSGASVVSDSWGSTIGDVFEDAAEHTAFDNTFMLADATGVSVMFSSGDSGDNFAGTGFDIPNYPASSPFITAVGGTTLEIGNQGQRTAELGWSTAKQLLCGGMTITKPTCGSATTPVGQLAFQAGGGGGTSFTYNQPFYQAAVVPPALALRNAPLFGPVPLRVIPDVSMDADAQSGMLIGLRQTYPGNNVHYGQFKEGGTSLASPLFAGFVADADSLAEAANGVPLGFLNPALYSAAVSSPSAFNDIMPPAGPAGVIRVDFTNGVDASGGFNISARAIDYEGPEAFCDGTGNCETRSVTLSTGPGFDSLTGIGSVGPDFLAAMSKF